VDKRTFIKSVLLGSTGLLVASQTSGLKAARVKKKWDGRFVLPELAYTYHALEPHIDAQTLKLHYSTYHASYTEQFNADVKRSGLTGKTAFEILSHVSAYSESIRHSGGAYLNHKLFWKMLTPARGQQPSAELMHALGKDFGSFNAFKEKFNEQAGSVPGSGWSWLIYSDGKLRITTTTSHDNPVMDLAPVKGTPLLCLDMWDHACPGNCASKSAYVDAFWNVVNWDFVSMRYAKNKNRKQPLRIFS
jgi:superoxide dismutase, Fe-Mn family